MYDMHNQLAFRPLISAAVLTASSANVKVDRQGYEALELVFDIGVGGITFTGTNRVDFTATHSDDDITYTAVADSDLLGVTGTTGGIIKSLIVAHAAGDITKVGYIGNKRYVKLQAVFGGTHATGTPMAVQAILGRPMIAPAS